MSSTWFSKLVLLAILSASTALARSEKLAPADRHVILVSIDGFPSYLWHDESLEVPRLRQLARSGSTAKSLSVSNPSITWINHTTMVTGVEPRKHGVLFNGLLVRDGDRKPLRLEQWADKDRLVRVPTLYDVAKAAGLTTAESDWVAVTRAPHIDWSFPEIPSVEGPIEREMIEAGIIREQDIQWMQPGPGRKSVAFLDSMWTKAAIHLFQKHRPNLLLYHTLNTDYTHHVYGPGSNPGMTALSYADRLLGDLLDAVNETGLMSKTTIVVTTDHGFKKVNRFIQPNVLLKQQGLIRGLGPTISDCDAHVMTQGGMAFVYVTNPARRDELLPLLRTMMEELEGVDQVIDGAEGHRLGMPAAGEHEGMGDLIVYAKGGYAFRGQITGDEVVIPALNYAGTHGYPANDPELDGVFIASGYGIKPGVQLERVSNLDIAPTLARLMGVSLPDTDGRVLEEILIPELLPVE